MIDPQTKYLAEFNLLSDRLSNGKDAVDMTNEFWEKLAYIEYNYAKSIAQLCNSRHGKLQKIFTDRTAEYFRPLQSVWGAVLEDLLTYSEAHLNVAYTLQREIKPGLNNFSKDVLEKQIETATHGKKVLSSLKEDQTKLTVERKKVYKAILSESSEEMKEIKDDVIENQNRTKQLQKLWIRSRDSHAHAFNVTMPSILEELNTSSVQRVEAVCQSVAHFVSLMGAAPNQFSTTSSTLLAAQTSSKTVRYKMECRSPEPPGDLNLNLSRAEMLDLCKNPAKKFLNNIQEKVFPANVTGMFVTPGGSREEGPLKEISSKVATMWTNMRSRTLSGNPLPSEDTAIVDDVLLDPEDEIILDAGIGTVTDPPPGIMFESGRVQLLDPGTVTGRLALEDEESTNPGISSLNPLTSSDPEPFSSAHNGLLLSTEEPCVSPPGYGPGEVPVSSFSQHKGMPAGRELADLAGNPTGTTDSLREEDMIIALPADPDGSEDYVVVSEGSS